MTSIQQKPTKQKGNRRERIKMMGQGQKNKRQPIRVMNRQKKKQKEREEKRKKKENEQKRQNFQLEARKAQAVGRWSAVGSESDSEISILTPNPNAAFTPQPLRRQNVPSPRLTSPNHQACLPSTATPASFHTSPINQPLSNPVTPVHSTLPAQSSTATPTNTTLSNTVQLTLSNQHVSPNATTPVQTTMPGQYRDKTLAKRKQATTPGKSLQSKRDCNPRRGIPFQHVMGDSSNDEESEDSDEDSTNMNDQCSTSSSSCCKELKLENEALRKRLGKVHKRLNIACKCLQLQ